MNQWLTTNHVWIPAIILGLATASGCASTGAVEPPKTFKVQGKVIGQDGRPLPGGRITFHPEEPSGSEAIAEIERDGSFALATFAKNDGAMPGRYKVSIDPVSYKDGLARTAARVPSKYTDPRTSGLTAEVTKETVLEPFHLR